VRRSNRRLRSPKTRATPSARLRATQYLPHHKTPHFSERREGVAGEDPRQEAVAIIKRGAARIMQLSEEDIAEGVRAYFQDTHNVAEGAGAAPLAGLMQERARMTGRRVAVILSGGNIDASVYRRILAGETPKVG